MDTPDDIPDNALTAAIGRLLERDGGAFAILSSELEVVHAGRRAPREVAGVADWETVLARLRAVSPGALEGVGSAAGAAWKGNLPPDPDIPGSAEAASLEILPVGFDAAGRPILHGIVLSKAAGAPKESSSDVADSRWADPDARRNRDAAADENRARTMFLAVMSHEIRTPLNALVGLSHLLARMELGPRQRDHAEKIQTAGLALQALVDDILEFTRIEVGRIELNDVTFRIGDVLRVLEAVLGEKARAKGISLVLEADPALLGGLRCDKYRLCQILINLVGNAVKFTPSGGVDVECRVVGRREGALLVRFCVTDSGIGMAPEQMARLFKPFSQGDGSITRRFGGTGLGLSIARKLVERMGGSLLVESSPGRGSTFHFEIWIDRVEETVPEVETSMEGLLTASDAHLRDLRILLVEDDDMNRETSSDLLASEGANVLKARDGAEALSILQEERGDFDVVLMDVEMPVLDGLETVRRMKADPTLRRIPVVAITAHSSPDDWPAYRDAGFCDRVAKPFEMSGLRETILRWTDSSGTPDSSTDFDIPPAAGGELDRERGLSRFGARRVYAGVLPRFLEEQGGVLGEIARLVTEGERHDARAKARSLRAACGIVGATELQRRARLLELALGAEGDVANLISAAERSFHRLNREVLAFLEEMDDDDAGEAAPPPESREVAELLDLLRRSEGAAVDLYQSMSPGLRTLLGKERHAVLDDAMRSFDFDRGVSILESIQTGGDE